MDNQKFIALCSRSWSLPVLAALEGGCPPRVSPLAARLGTGRTSVSATFEHLQALGLITRSPGHGHPLRPEFILTEDGRQLAQWAATLSQTAPGEAWPLLRRNWTLPVLRQLDQPQRFGQLRKALAPVTDRALSLSLKDLSNQNWVARSVNTAMNPPQVSYAAIGIGAQIQPMLAKTYSITP